MKIIRRKTFETNSSSTHSITMCSKEDFEKWKAGELYYDEWDDVLVKEQLDEDRYQTFDEWANDDYLETYVENYKTKNGEEIVAFGKYGYNG